MHLPSEGDINSISSLFSLISSQGGHKTYNKQDCHRKSGDNFFSLHQRCVSISQTLAEKPILCSTLHYPGGVGGRGRYEKAGGADLNS